MRSGMPKIVRSRTPGEASAEEFEVGKRSRSESCNLSMIGVGEMGRKVSDRVGIDLAEADGLVSAFVEGDGETADAREDVEIPHGEGGRK